VALIWVPFLGLAFWALDYPFMKRYSKELLEKRPELKGKDLEITKAAYEVAYLRTLTAHYLLKRLYPVQPGETILYQRHKIMTRKGFPF